MVTLAVRPEPQQAPKPADDRLTPNWFAAVMGTGIVASSAVTLPVRIPGLVAAAHVVWVLAAALLVVLTGKALRGLKGLQDPVMMQFFGAPAMALMTVGGGTLLVGQDWLGRSAALTTDLVLWGPAPRSAWSPPSGSRI